MMRGLPSSKKKTARTEEVIVFRVGGSLFAISSAAVREVKDVDSMSGAACEIVHPAISKVRHMVRRGAQDVYAVNGALHFGLRATPPKLIFVLRQPKTALLVDSIEQMAAISLLHALPPVFQKEERFWYRGLTVIDQQVVPVVKPDAFLTAEELQLLDALVKPRAESAAVGAEEKTVFVQ